MFNKLLNGFMLVFICRRVSTTSTKDIKTEESYCKKKLFHGILFCLNKTK